MHAGIPPNPTGDLHSGTVGHVQVTSPPRDALCVRDAQIHRIRGTIQISLRYTPSPLQAGHEYCQDEDPGYPCVCVGPRANGMVRLPADRLPTGAALLVVTRTPSISRARFAAGVIVRPRTRTPMHIPVHLAGLVVKVTARHVRPARLCGPKWRRPIQTSSHAA
jgi:hypothetical protein